MNRDEVLNEAAVLEWRLNHPVGGEAGPTEDLEKALARLTEEASGDHEAELRVSQLALVQRELVVLHEAIGAVARAEGVDLHGITGSETSCSPAALSAISGRSSDECGDALAQEATRFAGSLRLKANQVRVQALLLPGSRQKRMRSAAEADRMAAEIERRSRSFLPAVKPAASALGLKLVPVYEKDSTRRCVAKFIRGLEPGRYFVCAGSQSSGHAVAVQVIDDGEIWFADNTCRRAVPFFPSARPFRQINPRQVVRWCARADPHVTTRSNADSLGPAIDQLAAVLHDIQSRVVVDD